jgi:Co/Zn/Cd efflux system component
MRYTPGIHRSGVLMKKKTGLFILVLGVVVVVAAFMGVTKPDELAFNADVMNWEGARQGLGAAGLLLGLWGLYAFTRKSDKKKK